MSPPVVVAATVSIATVSPALSPPEISEVPPPLSPTVTAVVTRLPSTTLSTVLAEAEVFTAPVGTVSTLSFSAVTTAAVALTPEYRPSVRPVIVTT